MDQEEGRVARADQGDGAALNAGNEFGFRIVLPFFVAKAMGFSRWFAATRMMSFWGLNDPVLTPPIPPAWLAEFIGKVNTRRCDFKNRSLLYKRARYYDVTSGEFTSQDPLAYVDGNSLYRAYFVSDSIDPIGLFTQEVVDDPFENSESKTMLFREYWKWWLKKHPDLGRVREKRLRKRLTLGCVGVSILNLGANDITNLGHNCYKTKLQAEAVLKRTKCNNGGEPRLFSIHLWMDGKRLPLNFKHPSDQRLKKWWNFLVVLRMLGIDIHSGHLDMSDWMNGGRPNSRGKGWMNFDFGFVCNNGTILHADKYDNPDLDGDGKGDFYPKTKPPRDATLYGSTLDEWQQTVEDWGDFDTEVWCFRCQTKWAKCK